MLQLVHISDLKVSQREDNVLVTHALGSCIGVTVYDPVNKIGGMLHYMLPESLKGSIENRYMFAETAVPLLLKQYEKWGGKLANAVIKACGGANIRLSPNLFDIGKRNVNSLIQILDRHNLYLNGSDFGGNFYRTMKLTIDSGKVTCVNHLKGSWEI